MNIAEILMAESDHSTQARELVTELLGEVKVCSISERQAEALAAILRNAQNRKDNKCTASQLLRSLR